MIPSRAGRRTRRPARASPSHRPALRTETPWHSRRTPRRTSTARCSWRRPGNRRCCASWTRTSLPRATTPAAGRRARKWRRPLRSAPMTTCSTTIAAGAHIAKGMSWWSCSATSSATTWVHDGGLGAGIVHVADPELGVLGQSGTLGGSQLIAAGAALSVEAAHDRPGHHVLLRGRCRQPRHLPRGGQRGRRLEAAVVFVVQNNGWAVSVPQSHSTGGIIRTTVPSATAWPVSRGRRPGPLRCLRRRDRSRGAGAHGGGPSLIEAHTVRLDAATTQ